MGASNCHAVERKAGVGRHPILDSRPRHCAGAENIEYGGTSGSREAYHTVTHNSTRFGTEPGLLKGNEFHAIVSRVCYAAF